MRVTVYDVNMSPLGGLGGGILWRPPRLQLVTTCCQLQFIRRTRTTKLHTTDIKIVTLTR